MAVATRRDKPRTPRRRPPRQVRFSISLPSEIALFLARAAGSRRKAKSAVVAEALLVLQRDERRQRTLRALVANHDFDEALAEEGVRLSDVAAAGDWPISEN